MAQTRAAPAARTGGTTNATAAAFFLLLVLPAGTAAAVYCLPVLAAAAAAALPAWLLGRRAAVLPLLVGAGAAAWLWRGGADPQAVGAGYAAAQRLAGAALVARLGGTPLGALPWQPWLAGVVPLALAAGGVLALTLTLFHPAFQGRPTRASQEGVPGWNGLEHAGWNALGSTLPDAAGVLEDQARTKGKRVYLAGPHFLLGSVGILHAPSSTGKSRWLAEVVRAISRGEPVFGWPTVRGAAVWVTEETLTVWQDKGKLLADPPVPLRWWHGRARLRRRVRRWLRETFPRRYPPAVWPVSLPDLGIEPTLETFPHLLALVERLVARTGAKLVILDTLMAVCPEAVGNNAAAKVFMRQCTGLAARRKVAVEIVHHDNANGAVLGATMLKGAADFTHHLTRLADAAPDDPRRQVAFDKRYDPMPPPPLVYAMRPDGRLEACAGAESGDPAAAAFPMEPPAERAPEPAAFPAFPALPAPRDPRARVVEVATALCAAEGHCTLPQLVLVTGLPKTTVYRHLGALAAAGVLTETKPAGKTAPARWALAAGAAELPPAAQE